jgi:hypothetical protein
MVMMVNVVYIRSFLALTDEINGHSYKMRPDLMLCPDCITKTMMEALCGMDMCLARGGNVWFDGGLGWGKAYEDGPPPGPKSQDFSMNCIM